MEKVAFAILLAVAALSMFGCAQSAAPAQNETGSGAKFTLPASDVSYHARYTVEEGGPMTKEVWRSQDMMRTDLSSQGVRVLSFFYIDGKAYTCSFASQQPYCYDVTATLSQSDAARLVPTEKDMAGAARVESVKIGSATGSCYDVSIGFQGMRKLCFAPQGVLAYDSYNVTKALAHFEYMTDIEYFEKGSGPDESVFALPAKPVAAPPVPALPEGGLGE